MGEGTFSRASPRGTTDSIRRFRVPPGVGIHRGAARDTGGAATYEYHYRMFYGIAAWRRDKSIGPGPPVRERFAKSPCDGINEKGTPCIALLLPGWTVPDLSFVGELDTVESRWNCAFYVYGQYGLLPSVTAEGPCDLLSNGVEEIREIVEVAGVWINVGMVCINEEGARGWDHRFVSLLAFIAKK